MFSNSIKIFNIPDVVYFYNEGTKNIDFEELKNFIIETFGILDIKTIKIKQKIICINGIVLNLPCTLKNFDKLSYSKIKNACHIIITDKIFASLDEFNKPHIRAAIFSYPSIISLSGIVEGPAKPKEFYIYKQRYMLMKIWDFKENAVKEKFKNRFIDYQDKRMQEILKGYISQALFFYVLEEPFCSFKFCRAYNSHWQQELIYSQIKSGRFCSYHKKIIKEIKNRYSFSEFLN